MDTSRSQITVKGIPIDLEDNLLDTQDTEHILIKLNDGINRTVLAVLEYLGVDIQQDLGDDIWLCHNPSKELAKVKAQEFVGFVLEYHSFLKIGSELKNAQGNKPTFDSIGGVVGF